MFDDLGNLFTVNNDNDTEDNPRLLHLVEDGAYGWHSGALWVDGHASRLTPTFRKPWYEDGLWREHHHGQPAWVMLKADVTQRSSSSAMPPLVFPVPPRTPRPCGICRHAECQGRG